MRIARPLLDQIVAHAQRDAPNECFGVVGVRDGAAATVYELENVAHSPYRFDSGYDLAQALFAIEDAGEELGAIYHSHTRSAPEPSQTDVNWALQNYPGVEWLIVGLRPEVTWRSWVIEDGGVPREVEVEVT
jgi:[CysO sulfur-carrier protein]-S-L-cysteine hydrolase